MAKLAPPATMKTPVRAALRGRPGLASQELFSKECRVRYLSDYGSALPGKVQFTVEETGEPLGF